MNRIIKKISVFLIVLTLLCTVGSTLTYAQSLVPDVGEYEPNEQDTPENITTIIGKIANVIQIVGVVISAVVLVGLGIKYMVGSTEARAEYKKTMIPYLVGAFMIATIGTIVKVISELTSNVIGE